jgi:hypothetical protein
MLVRPGNSVQIETYLSALDLHLDGVDFAVRQPLKFVGQAKLVEEPQGAGVHGIAPKVAQEVGVFFHHRDVDTGAGEQQAQHDPRGAAAGDDARGFVRLGRHLAIFASNRLAG